MSILDQVDRQKWLIKKLPKQLIIQFTDYCNASCPQCGMRKTEKFNRSLLESEQIKKIIDTAASEKFQVISFTGGEPLLHPEKLISYINYASQAGIKYIRTGTNGFIFNNLDKSANLLRLKKIIRDLSETSLRNFWISIDSAIPEEHEKMRGFPVLISGIKKALPLFHKAGIFPAANLGINRNLNGIKTRFRFNHEKNHAAIFYDQYIAGFEAFFDFVISLGFTTVNFCYPMSLSENSELKNIYGASSLDEIVKFHPEEKSQLFKALYDIIPHYRSSIRIFPPRSSLLSLSRFYNSSVTHKPFPCLGGINYYFIDAKNGHTYPCGYRAENDYGPFEEKNWKDQETYPSCLKCDWECFRDPSELLAPIIKSMANPLEILKNCFQDMEMTKAWFNDISYYLACNLFNGRQAPEYPKMRFFN